jgi:hypothetical protein
MGISMSSIYDEWLYDLDCANPKCRKRFQKILRSLVNVNEVPCPHCGTVIDIRESKSTGAIGHAFDTANQIDIQRRTEKALPERS